MKLVAFCALFAAALATEHAAAQAYPVKPLRMIVAQSAGGNADIVARAVGQKLAAALGQPLVIDNRGGGGGIIAVEMAVKAPPDGYTLLLVSSAFGVTPSLHHKLPYDPLRDLAPITLVASAPKILVVHPARGALKCYSTGIAVIISLTHEKQISWPVHASAIPHAANCFGGLT